MASDGQVTYDDTILKANARKVRTLYHEQILAGFAGAAADALTLFERFEEKLERFKGNISRSAVDMAKDWRTDRYLRRLDAQLAVMNHQHLFILSGTGDVIEPDDNVIAIGAGGSYALAAARALVAHSDLSAEEIVREAMMITASICIYTNTSLTVERLDST
jgi:ATP-dependent HslUV protease subunit HslV